MHSLDWLRLSTILGVGISVSGCATGLPGLTADQYLPLNIVVSRIRCELQKAASEAVSHDPSFAKWQMSYAITLKANEIGGVGSSGNSFPFVIAPTVIASLGIGGGYTQTSNRTAIFKFATNVGQPIYEQECRTQGLHPFLTGDIGFREWLMRAIQAAGNGGVEPGALKELSSISHTFEFTVRTTGAASAGFAITPARSTSLINAGLTGERFDDHIVEVAFAKPDPPADPKIVTVIVKELSKKQQIDIDNLNRERTENNRERLDLITKNKLIEKLPPSLQGIEDQSRFEANSNKITVLNRSIDEKREQIDKIRRSPDKEKIERKVVSVKPSPLTNGNLNSSLLQLQLERLNTTLGNSIGRF